jgi:hypothetical protein
MPDFRKRRQFVLVFLVVALASGGVWTALRNSHEPLPPSSRETRQHSPQTPPPPILSNSPYLNTSSKAGYVGSQTCVECHDDENQSFLRTAHSRALGDVNVAEEPPDVTFLHEKSGRTYQVYRKDGKLRHREFILDGPDEVVLADHPIAYTIGSGHHSRSYLIKTEGYLFESPITWYAAKKSWGLSPGYDRPTHSSFSRPIDQGCINCHAGRVEPKGESPYRLKFHEQKIGCESCHGPGSLHVAHRNQNNADEKEPDLTIVHPGTLSRTLNEAICARCHLRGAATVYVRGRQLNEFRPGLPLTDFRIDYRLDDPDSRMKVTGHFEQMRRSRCYTQSTDLTCTTCHNPHDKPTNPERIGYYRSKCVSCHDGDEGCQLPDSQRLARSPQNDCVSCHMPRVDTEIPHFAFTHHRIGLEHAMEYSPKRLADVNLKPVGDVSRMSQLDRDRCLGLAYLESSDLSRGRKRDSHRDKAFRLLARAYDAGIRDADVTSSLARLLWEQRMDGSFNLARETLSKKEIPTVARVNILIVLGDTLLQAHNSRDAESMFQQLTELRMDDVDWRTLGECRALNNNPEGAILAFKKALAIRSDRPKIHAMLAETYARTGRPDLAMKHRQQAERLARLNSPR